MSTETIEQPVTEAAEPETATTGAEVAVRPQRTSPMSVKLQYARALAKSGLLPAAYRERPENVLYAVEYGEMLGLPPMAAINGIHVIEGKPTASAALISALVRRAGHKLRVSGNDTQAVAQIVRADDPEFTFEAKWDLTRAAAAGLTGKGTWKKYPAAMLKARAITEAARDACEEALCGMHYTPEEMGAEVTEEGEPVPGDPWRQDGPAATVVTDQPWLDSILERAPQVGEDDYAALWQAATEGQRAGKCTIAELSHAQGLIKARIEDVRRTAAEATTEADVVDAEIVDDPAGLEPEDAWATGVEDITCHADADAARADLALSLKNKSITSDRYQQVLAAIDARLASLDGQVAA